MYAGASGFSYPSWCGGFYPRDAKPADFLRLYAERLPAVELNTTFYRLPSQEQLERWAAATSPGFRFTVKMTRSITHGGRLEHLPAFCQRVRALGERLGPVLVRLADTRPRDDGFLHLFLDSLPPGLQVALDLRDPSWDGVEPLLASRDAVRVNAVEGSAGFRYLRLRRPPYDESSLAELATLLRPLLAEGVDVFCFFKHEEEPTAPAYASRLLELVE